MRLFAKLLCVSFLLFCTTAWSQYKEMTDVETAQLKGHVKRVTTASVPEYFYDKNDKVVANSGPYTTKFITEYNTQGYKLYDSFYATQNPLDRDFGKNTYTIIDYNDKGRMTKAVSLDNEGITITDTKVWDAQGRLKEHHRSSTYVAYNFDKLYLHPGEQWKGNVNEFSVISVLNDNDQVLKMCRRTDTEFYFYNNKGDITAKVESGVKARKKTTIHTYKKHRVTGEMVYYDGVIPVSITRYKYDKHGNEVAMVYERLYTERNAEKFTPKYKDGTVENIFPTDSGSAATRITGYDKYGNMTSKQLTITTPKDTFRFTWNNTYTYDDKGNVLSKNSTGTEMNRTMIPTSDIYLYDHENNWIMHTTFYNTHRRELLRRKIEYF